MTPYYGALILEEGTKRHEDLEGWNCVARSVQRKDLGDCEGEVCPDKRIQPCPLTITLTKNGSLLSG
jgi:hypothetical protein